MMNAKKMMLMTVLCAAFIVFGMVSSASALTINADDYPYPGGLPSLYWWAGLETGQAAIDAIVGPIMGDAPELYKQDAAPTGGAQPADEGPFAGSYSTPLPGDSSGATITWDGGPYIVGSPLYLLVKDGNATPAWYLFGLNDVESPLTWNGMDNIVLENFWVNQGAISHVTIYGNGPGPDPVPEPATMLLLGSGLVGLAGYGRRKVSKKIGSH